MSSAAPALDEASADVPPPSVRVGHSAWRASKLGPAERTVPEETAVALVYDGATQAVMMATPADLEDFAVGFSLSEGIVASPAEIESLDIVPLAEGVELRMWLSSDRGAMLVARRRHFAGPTGCGLCGIDSLAEAMRAARRVTADLQVKADRIAAALQALAEAQPLNRATRAVHAAALWSETAGLSAVREDVGRHNALDKLVGAAAQEGLPRAASVLLLTSRVSVEMVQKAAILGAPVVAAVSAPTALAIRMAEAAGITLVAVARADGFEIFTHPGRIAG